MKIVVIGGVAAGTKAAAKLKREQPDAEVVLYSKGTDISYAGCGLPYYVGGSIPTREELIVNTPAKYAGLTRVAVHTGQEAIALDPARKNVTLRAAADNTTIYASSSTPTGVTAPSWPPPSKPTTSSKTPPRSNCQLVSSIGSRPGV